MASYIQYLERHQIDDQKWDRCIDESPDGLIYGYSFYLDIMARNWSGLVLDDYKHVMPLTWNRKWGLSYLYQPAFTASLGVFSTVKGARRTADFISAIPSRFKLIEIDLNAGNRDLQSPERVNYILSLQPTYEALFNGFRESTKRNIRKAVQLNCRYETGIDIDPIIALAQEQSKSFSNLGEDEYGRFRNLFAALKKRGKALTAGVFTERGELVASCVYFFSHKRAYYILVGNHPNGKTLGASHFLIDRFIYGHAGEDLTLDFEGSDIRNLAFFYSSFGAMVEKYPTLRINRLPWWARIFK